MMLFRRMHQRDVQDELKPSSMWMASTETDVIVKRERKKPSPKVPQIPSKQGLKDSDNCSVTNSSH